MVASTTLNRPSNGNGHAAAPEATPAKPMPHFGPIQPLLDDPAVYPPADVAERLVTLVDVGSAAKVYDAGWKRVSG